MPIYDYRCQECKAEIAIVRTMNEHDVPPSEEEVRDVAVCGPEHKLVRFLKGSPTVVKAPGFGYKGYW